MQVVHQRAKRLVDDSHATRSTEGMEESEGVNEEDTPQVHMSTEAEPGAYAEAPGEQGHRTDRLRYSLVGEVLTDESTTNSAAELMGENHKDIGKKDPCPFASHLDGTTCGEVLEARPVMEAEENLEDTEPVDLESQQTEQERRKRKQQQLQLIMGLIFVVLIVAIFVAVFVTQLGGKTNIQKEGRLGTPTLVPLSIASTTAPSMAATNALESILTGLPDYTIKSLQDLSSPQSQVFTWLGTHQES